MRRGHHFDITLDYNEEPVRVVGEISPYYPAQGPTYSCGGQPAEGGEIEDYKIFDASGNEIEDPDGIIIEALQDEIYEKVSDLIAADMCEAAEHRRESMEDR